MSVNHVYGYSVYFIVPIFFQYQILLMENKHWDFSSLCFFSIYSSFTCYNVNVNVCVFSHSVVSYSLWPHGLQHTRFPCPSSSSGFCPSSCPLSWWCSITISSSAAPSPFAFNLSQHQSFIQWVHSSHKGAKVLRLQLQHQSSNEYSGLISFRTDYFNLLSM